MKTLLIILFGFLFVGQINGQLNEKCLPKNLIVVAENLNFRTQPNTNSKSIARLENSELLTFIGLVRENDEDNYYDISSSWIKVKRNRTGEIGYVFGEYVMSQEMAYLNLNDADKIQSGNWYGIYNVGNKVLIEKSLPKISNSDEGFISLVSNHEKHRIIICSQEIINEGEITGNLRDEESLKIGINKRLAHIGNIDYSLACTGEYVIRNGNLIGENEKVILQKMFTSGLIKNYTQQDLTDCLLQFGGGEYIIHFTGDLNNDGVPELIISEASTQQRAVYYFRSNKSGILELQSISYFYSKC
jgi:hypothetical protein